MHQHGMFEDGEGEGALHLTLCILIHYVGSGDLKLEGFDVYVLPEVVCSHRQSNPCRQMISGGCSLTPRRMSKAWTCCSELQIGGILALFLLSTNN